MHAERTKKLNQERITHRAYAPTPRSGAEGGLPAHDFTCNVNPAQNGITESLVARVAHELIDPIKSKSMRGGTSAADDMALLAQSTTLGLSVL